MQKLSTNCQQIKSDSVKNLVYHGQKEVYSRYKRLVQYLKINVIHHFNRKKDKNHRSILVNEEKTTKYPSMKKEISANYKYKFLSLPQSIHEKPAASMKLHGELWNLFCYDKEHGKATFTTSISYWNE